MPRLNTDLLRQAFDLELALRTALTRYVGNAADTEELLHDIYAQLLKVPSAERKRLQFPRAVIGLVARNAVAKFMQSRNLMSPSGASHADFAAELRANQEMVQLAEVVEKLPIRVRQAFTLRMVYGCSPQDISKRLKLSTPTIRHYVRLTLSHMSKEDRELVEGDAGASAPDRSPGEATGTEFYDVSKEILVPSTEISRAVAPRIVDASAGLAELLKRQPESVYELAPIQFEHLIAELLRNLGYQVVKKPGFATPLIHTKSRTNDPGNTRLDSSQDIAGDNPPRRNTPAPARSPT
jgi:DNA-directed RNA polymerase specialized sigma24 family protein